MHMEESEKDYGEKTYYEATQNCTKGQESLALTIESEQ